MGDSVSMEKRYHVHVCYASNDLTLERSMMMQKLARNCFFTWSLQDDNALASNYSRSQIDECDYVFFLVGKKYGELSASGVSYLHLDYIYANSKLKPILAFLLNSTESGQEDKSDTDSIFNQRKLMDFRSNLSNTCKNVYTFGTVNEFANKLNVAFGGIVEQNPTTGWIVANKTVTQTMPALSQADISGEYETLGIEKTTLYDKLSFNYRVQAFKDGNLKEITLTHAMPWGQLLGIIADAVRMPASEDVIPKTIHEYLDKLALAEVQKSMPEAHATARAQLRSKDIQNIKLQLLANDWVTTTDFSANGKKLFILTPQGARQVTQWRGKLERLKASQPMTAGL